MSANGSGMSGAGAGASLGGGVVQPLLRNLQQSNGAMQPGAPDPPVQHFPCPCRSVSHHMFQRGLDSMPSMCKTSKFKKRL
jgi:hypothetical protein